MTSVQDPPHPGAVTEPPRVSPYPLREKIGRVLWAVVSTLIWSHLPAGGLANAILRSFGAAIAPGARLHRTVRIEIPWNLTVGRDTVVAEHAILYCLGPVSIGDRCFIGPHAHVCAGTHDYTDPRFTLLRQPITIKDRCVVGIGAFIAPNVTVAEATIVRPRAGIFADTRPDTAYHGSPASPEAGGGS